VVLGLWDSLGWLSVQLHWPSGSHLVACRRDNVSGAADV
jgi:hypothetical protein